MGLCWYGTPLKSRMELDESHYEASAERQGAWKPLNATVKRQWDEMYALTGKTPVDVVQFLLSQRGYVVVAMMSARYTPGTIINDVWQLDLGQPFALLSQTTIEDWREQGTTVRDLCLERRADSLRGKYLDETPPAEYWRAVTD